MQMIRLSVMAAVLSVALILPVRAQIDLSTVLPAYPGVETVAIHAQGGDQVAVTTKDDVKALMIFYRKMLAYRGWQVLSGSVLHGDSTIVYQMGHKRLTVRSDAPAGKPGLILFTLAE